MDGPGSNAPQLFALMARIPAQSETVRQQQETAAEVLVRIADWTRSLREFGCDTYALSAATQRIVEQLAAREAVSPNDAEHALEAAAALRAQLGWALLEALRAASPVR